MLALQEIEKEILTLPKEDFSKLFAPFSCNEEPDSAGLGLPVSRQMMREYGGDLEIVDIGDEGTLFRIEMLRHT